MQLRGEQGGVARRGRGDSGELGDGIARRKVRPRVRRLAGAGVAGYVGGAAAVGSGAMAGAWAWSGRGKGAPGGGRLRVQQQQHSSRRWSRNAGARPAAAVSGAAGAHNDGHTARVAASCSECGASRSSAARRHSGACEGGGCSGLRGAGAELGFDGVKATGHGKMCRCLRWVPTAMLSTTVARTGPKGPRGYADNEFARRWFGLEWDEV
nr:glycine-rich protein DOT1-like [Aegilops tauschii subsp. strangulata]